MIYGNYQSQSPGLALSWCHSSSCFLLKVKMSSRYELKVSDTSCFVSLSGCGPAGGDSANVLLTASANISTTSSSEYLKSSGIYWSITKKPIEIALRIYAFL